MFWLRKQYQLLWMRFHNWRAVGLFSTRLDLLVLVVCALVRKNNNFYHIHRDGSSNYGWVEDLGANLGLGDFKLDTPLPPLQPDTWNVLPFPLQYQVPGDGAVSPEVQATNEWWCGRMGITTEEPAAVYTTKASIKGVLRSFDHKGLFYSIPEPVPLDISYENGLWVYRNEELNLFAYAKSPEAAREELYKNFAVVWKEYAKADDSLLDDRARQLKRALLRVCEVVETNTDKSNETEDHQ